LWQLLSPVMFFDVIRIKVRDQGTVSSNRAFTWRWVSRRMGFAADDQGS
jgi:hypothetical protein